MSINSLHSTSDLYLEFQAVINRIADAVSVAQSVLSVISTLQSNPNYAGNVSGVEATRLANCITYFTNMVNNAP